MKQWISSGIFLLCRLEIAKNGRPSEKDSRCHTFLDCISPS